MASNRAQHVHLNEIMTRINSTFGTITFPPVHYLNSELRAEDHYVLMCTGQVCIISTVRVGMGLIPVRWTVCQHVGNRRSVPPHRARTEAAAIVASPSSPASCMLMMLLMHPFIRCGAPASLFAYATSLNNNNNKVVPTIALPHPLLLSY